MKPILQNSQKIDYFSLNVFRTGSWPLPNFLFRTVVLTLFELAANLAKRVWRNTQVYKDQNLLKSTNFTQFLRYFKFGGTLKSSMTHQCVAATTVEKHCFRRKHLNGFSSPEMMKPLLLLIYLFMHH